MGINKATPFNLTLGTEDRSMRALEPTPKGLPIHNPIFFIHTQRGDYKEHSVAGAELNAIFGDETLNPLGKYINHQSVFAAGAIGAGGSVIVKRLPYIRTADDIDGETGKANMTLYATVSTTPHNTYKLKRDPITGKVLKDGTNYAVENDLFSTVYATRGNTVFAKKKSGQLVVSGQNDLGQTGNGKNVDLTEFTKLDMADVKDVVSTATFTAILKTDGTVWTSGDNSKGQLGEPARITARNTFKKLTIRNIVSIVADGDTLYAVNKFGELFATGLNDKGQCLNNDTADLFGFTNTGITNVEKVDAYNKSVYVLKRNNKLYVFGNNAKGQLGTGTNTDIATMDECASTKDKVVTDVHAVGDATYAVVDGKWSVTGDNSKGQLGNSGLGGALNVFTELTLPVAPKKIVFGTDTVLYIGTDGKLYSTGANDKGQCLNGNTTAVTDFTDTGVANVTDVFIMGNKSAYTATDGKLYVAGENGHTELGIAGTVTTPTEVPVVEVKEDVYYIRLTAKYHTDEELKAGLDIIPSTTGFTVDGTTLATTSYPLVTFQSIGHGLDYNNFGIALAPMTGDDTDKYMKEDKKQLNHGIVLYYKQNGRTTIIKNNVADRVTEFTFEPFSSHPKTNVANSLSDIFPTSYSFKTDPNSSEAIVNFEAPVIYQSNYDRLAQFVMEKEIIAGNDESLPYVDYTEPDITKAKATAEDEKYLANIFTLTTSAGAAYEAIRPANNVIVDTALAKEIGDAITASQNTPVFLQGGKDGDVKDNALMEEAVLYYISEYGDGDNPVTDVAKNNVSIFYDSGFTIDTKLKLAKFISVRRDTVLVASTYEWNEKNKKQPISEALSFGALLKSTYKLYPESTVFGTQTSRAAIIMGDGIKADKTYRYRLPMTYDFMVKAQKFMGASNSKWKPVYKFSRQPNNIVKELIDINPYHIPDSIKDRLWDAGLIWTQNEDRETYFYPSSQTVYDNDTSVLNIFSVNMALTYIVKMNDAAWRAFSGTDDLTNIELKIKVEKFMNDRLHGHFAGMFEVVPEVYFTDADANRGYSWHLAVKLYANNMKTVQESYEVALRMEDYK